MNIGDTKIDVSTKKLKLIPDSGTSLAIASDTTI